MSDASLEVPKASRGDLGLAVARGILGTMPGGSFLTEALNWIVTDPIERRRNEWMESAGAKLDELMGRREITPEQLKNDDKFIDSFIQITRAAIATGSEEKRAALQNALLNSALPEAPDETRRHMFVKLVDEFSASHLWLLHFLHDPESMYKNLGPVTPTKNFQSVWEVIIHVRPELRSAEHYWEQLCSESHRQGLLILRSLHGGRKHHYDPNRPRNEQHGYLRPWEIPIDGETYTGNARIIRPWTSKLGDEFLEFIRSPLQAVPVGP